MLQPQQATGLVTVQQIDINSIMNMMIMLVVIVMMMKMMTGALSGGGNPSSPHHQLERVDKGSLERAGRSADFVAEADLAMLIEVIPLVEEGRRDEAIIRIDQTLQKVAQISKKSDPELVDGYLFQVEHWLSKAKSIIITQPDGETLRIRLEEISGTLIRLRDRCLIAGYLKSSGTKGGSS